MGREKERAAVKAAYPSKKWSRRVDKMSDEQVVAVYLNLQQQRKVA